MLFSSNKLLKNPMLLRMARVLLVRIVAGFILLVSYLLIARTLGAAESGLYFLGFTVVTVVATFSRLGLDSSLVRFIAAYEQDHKWTIVNGMVRSSFVVVFLFSILCSSIIFAASHYLAINIFKRPEVESILQITSLSIPFVALAFMLGQSFMGLHSSNRAIFYQNIGIPLFFCITFSFSLLILPSVSSITAAICLLISSFIVVIYGIIIWYQQAWASWTGDNVRSQLFATAWPLWIVSIMNALTTWGAQLSAVPWLTPEVYAGFAVAQRLSNQISVTQSIVNMVVAPRFSAMHHNGDITGVAQVAQYALRVSLLLAIPAVVLVCSFPRWFLSFFGPEFTDAAPALVILVIGQLFYVAAGSTGYLLAMTGHAKDARNIAVIVGVLVVPVTVVLTKWLGLVGAALAATFILLLQSILQVIVVKHRLGFNPMRLRN